MPSSKGGKSKKAGRSKRKPGSKGQYLRTYQNKLARVNKERAKSGKEPLAFLPGYIIGTGVPEGKMIKQPLAPLNPRAARH